MPHIVAESFQTVAQGLGYKLQVVTRNPDLMAAVQNVRMRIATCEFDEPECEQGLVHLESYSKEWDTNNGVWKAKPRHDEHSHCADAFRTWGDGYMIPLPKVTENFRPRKVL